MRNRSFWGPLFVVLLLLAAAAAVGAGAYNAGVAHGFAEASRSVAVPVEGAARVYVWPGPWAGHGFGYFPVFPFVAVFFLFFVLRGIFWRAAWRGRGRCGPGYSSDGVPPFFEEWHRRAHERQAPPPAPDRTA
jgi:hypothetical protein